jgi:nucleoside-diphosphate-sugar epimerase
MKTKYVLVTGGGGYVGAVLVPKLLAAGYAVTVLDWYAYGDVLGAVAGSADLRQIKGDIRDPSAVAAALQGCDAVIHLACISNDPSFELDPALGKSVNYDATVSLIDASVAAGIRRFVYASSSSVYGVKEEDRVTEDLPLTPLTDYSKYKALSEAYLHHRAAGRMPYVILRPATVCGVSPRMRFDLTVNILTLQALATGEITVFGGGQQRPGIHIDDMTDLYVKALGYPDRLIDGKTYNAGYENHTVRETADMVRRIIGPASVRITVKPTVDTRSYHICSDLIRTELGFVPTHTVEDAIRDIRQAYRAGMFPDAMTDARYYNIRTMKAVLERAAGTMIL